jgi:hypothetical protein
VESGRGQAGSVRKGERERKVERRKKSPRSLRLSGKKPLIIDVFFFYRRGAEGAEVRPRRSGALQRFVSVDVKVEVNENLKAGTGRLGEASVPMGLS